MPDKGLSRTFADPIILPNGRELRTLRDAGNYIANLPKREHDAPAWRAATEASLPIVERGGDTLLARIGIVGALHRHHQVAPAPRNITATFGFKFSAHTGDFASCRPGRLPMRLPLCGQSICRGRFRAIYEYLTRT
jgi:hypothetical protein